MVRMSMVALLGGIVLVVAVVALVAFLNIKFNP